MGRFCTATQLKDGRSVAKIDQEEGKEVRVSELQMKYVSAHLGISLG
jgi:hypothetical protein